MNPDEIHAIANQRAKANELMYVIANFLIDAEQWNCPLLKSHLRAAYDSAQNMSIHHSKKLAEVLREAMGVK